MEERDVEIVVQRALEQHLSVTPRIISDNGPQFIAKDFKVFLRTFGLSHVRTSPYYPQNNGKLERFHGTLKQDGEVAFDDFLALSSNFGKSDRTWSTGDFTGDGETSFPDSLSCPRTLGNHHLPVLLCQSRQQQDFLESRLSVSRYGLEVVGRIIADMPGAS